MVQNDSQRCAAKTFGKVEVKYYHLVSSFHVMIRCRSWYFRSTGLSMNLTSSPLVAEYLLKPHPPIPEADKVARVVDDDEEVDDDGSPGQLLQCARDNVPVVAHGCVLTSPAGQSFYIKEGESYDNDHITTLKMNGKVCAVKLKNLPKKHVGNWGYKYTDLSFSSLP